MRILKDIKNTYMLDECINYEELTRNRLIELVEDLITIEEKYGKKQDNEAAGE